MNRWVPRLLVVLLLLALTTSTADAQRRARRRAIVAQSGPRYGAHLGYNFDNGGNALLGAQLSWPIVPALDLYPSFDYYFVSGGNLLTGLEGRRGRTRPYIEGKFILANNSSFQIVVGLSWR
ncbi:MAG: hypothetical protein AUG85_06455 [Gemmatimonadetes bacterium 13_1_20CM_4_66_11]|nr:MAG: hypothetical protein AUG85_06455 [Gemmatimonadetes bacterium 13_1_20CM_4_66_11]